MSARPSSPSTGRPDRPAPGGGLDGLRGLAVIAVIRFHGGVGGARGGFLGVEVFFVLSGYLITSLLVAEWLAPGEIALGAFWARRARRLLPARDHYDPMIDGEPGRRDGIHPDVFCSRLLEPRILSEARALLAPRGATTGG